MYVLYCILYIGFSALSRIEIRKGLECVGVFLGTFKNCKTLNQPLVIINENQPHSMWRDVNAKAR